MPRKKIDPEVNRARVKASLKRTGAERLNLYLPKGTISKLKELGYKPSSFAKSVVLSEIDKKNKEKGDMK